MAKLHDTQDVARITQEIYTTQRGRIVGNTRMWQDLTEDERLNMMDDVDSLLEYMRKAWQL